MSTRYDRYVPANDPASQTIAKLLAQADYPEMHAFVDFLRLKGLSIQTLDHYLRTLRDLCHHAQLGERSPRELTTAELRSYAADLQRRSLRPTTVASRVTDIKRFFAFLLMEGLIETDPSRRLPHPKVPKTLPKALTLAETRRLLAALSEDKPRWLRDKVLIVLMYACGLRVAEAVSIRLEQFDLEAGTLRVTGKGDKERRLYLKPQVVAVLRRYLAGVGPAEYLFPSPYQAHLSTDQAQAILKRYVRRAGLPEGVSPHTLRHSVATHYLLGGAPITFVQGLLGHANLATTGRYTGLVDEWAKEIALNTPLAVTVAAEKGPPGHRMLREPPAVDGDAWEYDEAAWYVENVLVLQRDFHYYETSGYERFKVRCRWCLRVR